MIFDKVIIVCLIILFIGIFVSFIISPTVGIWIQGVSVGAVVMYVYNSK